MKQQWQHDWKSFVQEVAKLVDKGLDNQALTRQFQNKRVQWLGRVHDRFFDDESPGVQLYLPDVRTRLKNGTILRANFLFASFKDMDAEFWKEVKNGTLVEFITKVKRGVNPFWGIRIVDIGKGVSLLKVGTHGIRPLILYSE